MSSATRPPTSVPASWAITIATRTVALTRPSCRSPTRAWRTEISVTSNTVTAVSPISCWPMRQAIATSGRPARRERDQEVAERREQQRRDDDRPEAEPAHGALGEHGAQQRPEPAERRDHADHRRVEVEVVGHEQQPRRAEHAPHRRQAHRPPGEAAQHRVVDDEPQALADLVA